jgi:hypothetical protein
VKVNNIHFYGCVCLFMSSKIHDTNSLRLGNLVKFVLHDQFSKSQVIQEEMRIMERMFSSKNEHLSSMPVLTIFELFTEVFKEGSKTEVTEGLRQLVIIWMDIRNVVPMGKNLKDLFAEMVVCVKQNRKYYGVEETFGFFSKTYGCNQIQKYYKDMKW